MSITDKLFFWRHKEPEFDEGPALGRSPNFDKDFGFDETALGKEHELGLPEEDSSQEFAPSSQNYPSSPPLQSSRYPQHQQQYPQSEMLNKDIELISAKLDALKATLENINQRLANLERIARESHEDYR